MAGAVHPFDNSQSQKSAHTCRPSHNSPIVPATSKETSCSSLGIVNRLVTSCRTSSVLLDKCRVEGVGGKRGELLLPLG